MLALVISTDYFFGIDAESDYIPGEIAELNNLSRESRIEPLFRLKKTRFRLIVQLLFEDVYGLNNLLENSR